MIREPMKVPGSSGIEKFKEVTTEWQQGIGNRSHSLAGIDKQLAQCSPKCCQVQGAHFLHPDPARDK
jgi:hypothetical protein